ncbi:MAG TPA: hypothetical protein VFO85_20280, partial [Vicinamibacteria bacterium]|nr:hypothetical protein [Vicinamibacteria bacterium]
NPGEAIADIHAFLRLSASCIGRGFFKNMVCQGYGDPCIGPPATGCTGVRDIDFDRRTCGRPHTVTWITAGFPAGHCIDGQARPPCPTGGGPCNRAEHCEGALVGEAAFDLARRDLPAAGHDANTAHELTTRLFLLASQAVGNWYTCTVGGGCGATGGYLLTLAADDDDGNLANGTPHMTAIRAAFERHEIHCATPAPVDSGCAGGPSAAPVLSAVPQDQGVSLAWTAVSGAARYDVYRTEGVNGEAFGKVKVAEVTGTAYVELNLQNGRQYHFLVLPVGASGSCLGRMSNAVSVVPVPGAGLSVLATPALDVAGGDGDDFLDNCELGTLTFTVENTGTGPLTNVRLVGVSFPSHPATILQTPLPASIAATLSECGSAAGSLAFTAQGLATDDALQVRVDVRADQLGGQVRSMVFTIVNTELDAQFVPTRTFDFDTDLQGWTVDSGTWTRQTPGAQGTTHHVSSSANAADACDVIRSPALRVRADSTLALHARYEIESTDPVGGPYDRANVGLRDTATGVRTVIAPSGGQLYNVPAGSPNGTCEQMGQAGWNSTSPGWPAFNESTWNAAALNPGGAFTSRVVHLEIRYGTDALVNHSGFDFDQVTLNRFDLLVPDAVPDVCLAQAVAPSALGLDAAGNSVLEPGELAVMAPTWRNIGFQAITLGGATSGFTGPPGPTYANPDASASYGTVAVGGTASCAATGDCYTVAVTALQRPATHWDSTIVETMAPAAVAKTWTLHVGGSFTDVPPASGFYRFVETLLHGGVTGGCAAEAYCPGAPTTREQMAVFVLVSREGSGYLPPACTTPLFADVPA